MGSHTDYNLGHVLTLPIDLDTWIAARPRDDGMVRVHSGAVDQDTQFSVTDPPHGPRWSDYLKGVISILQSEGLEVSGFDAVVDTTIPIGGGLSSSAALESATAVLCSALGGWTLDPLRMARLCQRAENEFVGVQCGILDQYSACVDAQGGALLLDCRDLTSARVAIAPGLGVVVCDTGSKHELATSEYGVRRAQCEEGARRLGVTSLRDASLEMLRARAHELPAVIAKRCRFIVEEDARVSALAVVLAAGDRAAIAGTMAESFRGARDLYEIGAASMDAMMAAMSAAPGFIGGRQSGGGFGGCLVAIADADLEDVFCESVRRAYKAVTGVDAPVFGVAAGRPAETLAIGDVEI
jgi:galactokinase